MERTPTVSHPSEARSRASAPSGRSANIAAAVADSCEELRSVERMIYASDKCSPAGLLLSQLRLALSRMVDGRPMTRSDCFALLHAGSRLSSEQ